MMLWMAVTMDEYELPVCVAETSTELCECIGVRRDTVSKALRFRNGLIKRENVRICKVFV